MNQKPVVIIGAGLSGLCCARQLLKHGINIVVVEAQDEVGGRIRTDRVDGFLLDRGFQVLQTAYAEATDQLDYSSLRLHNFEPGALIRTQGRTVEMSDPWRRPTKVLSTAFNGIGTLSDRLKLAKLRWHVTHTPIEHLWKEPESTTQEYLSTTCGLSSDMIDRFFRPWFSGVFLEQDLSTSSRFFRFLFRTFALGDAALPEQGMGAIPKQLAAEIDPTVIRLSTPVEHLTIGNAADGDPADGKRVRLKNGEVIDCRAIVLAVEGPEASRLTNGMIKTPEACPTTCFYYAAPQPPFREALLVLNGDMQGPVNNLCVVSNVAGSYAPDGQSLISVSVVGKLATGTDDVEGNVRRQLKDWYGTAVDSWSLLKSYHIPFALPRQPAHFRDAGVSPARLANGIYHCGDYAESASIQGAMVSGRKAADAVIADLS